MKKINKLFLAAGSIAAVAAPVAAVVSCGAGSDDLAVNCGGYAGAFQKLANGDITVAGAWGDARFYAGAEAKNINAVGIETTRISNDGIQVRGNMKKGDEIALQTIFPKLIQLSKMSEHADDLQLTVDGKLKSLFSIYSHDGYMPLYSGHKVNVMNETGHVVETDVNSDITAGTAFTAAESDYFQEDATSTLGFVSKAEQKTPLKITFIPSNDPAQVTKATEKLNAFFTKAKINVVINVSSNYNVAATSLKTNQIDVAFLPVETWAQQAQGTRFIISAVRPTQIATLDFSNNAVKPSTTTITNETKALDLFNKYGQLFLSDVVAHKDVTDAATLPTDADAHLKTFFANALATSGNEDEKAILNYAKTLTGATATADEAATAYEAWIYARQDSEFAKDVKANTRDWATVRPHVIYGYTSTTSASSYVYPEIWFKHHFDGFNSFQG